MRNSSSRLAIFLHGLYGGGVERVMLNLARGISERNYPVDLILVRATGPYSNQIPDAIRVIDLKAHRALFSIPALVRYLNHERPMALLSTIDYTNVIALLASRFVRKRPRILVAEHDTFSHRISQISWKYRILLSTFHRLFYPWADTIIAVSNGAANDLTQTTGISRDRIRVISNPVITPDLYKMVKESPQHPWFESNNIPIILAVGRLTKQKDFPTLLYAFSEVRKHRLARLIILGEGEDRQFLEELILQLGISEDVDLPGFVPNPYAYMSHANLFVLSSRWEGLPTVLIEALFCGLPVVSTDCPSGPLEILKNGQYGLLVPVGNTGALELAICSALNGDTPFPIDESWQIYEMEKVVDQYLNVLLKD